MNVWHQKQTFDVAAAADDVVYYDDDDDVVATHVPHDSMSRIMQRT